MELATLDASPEAPDRLFKPYGNLPSELWVHVVSSISSVDEIPRAWFAYRLVSKRFCWATEEAFRRHYVRRKMWINYDLGWGRGIDNTADLCALDINMVFSRFEDSGQRVVFGDKDAANEERKRELVMCKAEEPQRQRWEADVMGRYRLTDKCLVDGVWCLGQLEHIHVEPHVVVLHSLVMDKPLPGLEVDGDKREVSFLWKPLLNGFFGDELHVRNLERTGIRCDTARLMAMISPGRPAQPTSASRLKKLDALRHWSWQTNR